MKVILFLLLYIPNLFASLKNDTSYLFSVNLNIPVFGEFGDRKNGFKETYGFNLSVLKNYDDLISYGFIVSQSFYYKNRNVDLKFRIFSFTPAIFGFIDIEKKYYFYIGAGIYHWSQPSSTYNSTSGDEGGFRVGFGYKKIYKKIGYGSGIEFNHLFNINGKNFDLGPSNILSFYINISVD